LFICCRRFTSGIGESTPSVRCESPQGMWPAFDRTTVRRLLRWAGSGVAFMAVSSASLYALVDLLGVPVPIATLVTAEVCTLLRFLVNHYWVFGQRRPSWRQCAEYHLATAGGFITWWTIS